MMKMVAEGKDGKNLLAIGLTKDSVLHLMAGKGVILEPPELMFLSIHRVCFFYGKTEKLIFEAMMEAGIINSTTKMEFATSKSPSDKSH
jgi:hypothetical protein